MNNKINLEGCIVEPNNILALTSKEGLITELEEGRFYKFNKNGFLIFPIGKEMQLRELEIDMNEERKIGTLLATIQITHTAQNLLGGIISTSGEYIVKKVIYK